eukprot:CAMPEP_0118931776 /NCGR_PEP_ID=MMETSP1169-20130426/7997_1 /TAXON_ID=36882 /ORGANISM="Pyramimonas obovata, Strain CCMP722" /LENGTH=201 /DNA_ID=CAMNT_0006874315 /DNA_START=513 /DNA_END=1114 /DNA_ORIENTATION=-
MSTSWNPGQNSGDPAPELAPLDQGNTCFGQFRRFCSKIFCGLSCSRIMNFVLFACVCLGSLLQQVAAVIIAIVDTLTLTILFFACELGEDEYHFNTNTLDVVLVSVGRSVANVTAYLVFGDSQNCHKPYLYSAFSTGAFTLIFVFLKVVLYEYKDQSKHETWAAVLMFVISAVAALAHGFHAQTLHAAARKRRKVMLTAPG